MMFPAFFTCLGYGLRTMKVEWPQESPVKSLRSFANRLFSASGPPSPQDVTSHDTKSLPLPSILTNIILITTSYLIVAFAHPGYYARRLTYITVLNSLMVAQLSLRHIFGVKMAQWKAMAIRWTIVALAIIFSVFFILDGLNLNWVLSERGYNYILLVFIMTFILHRFSQQPISDQTHRQKLAVVSVRATVIGSLYILTVFSFAHTIYNHIPAEKGGGDFSEAPDATVCFLESYRSSVPSGLVANFGQNPLCTVPVKIIEETPLAVYIARTSDRGSHTEVSSAPVLWRAASYYPVVFNVSKASIGSVVVMNQGHVEVSIPAVQTPLQVKVVVDLPSKPRDVPDHFPSSEHTPPKPK